MQINDVHNICRWNHQNVFSSISHIFLTSSSRMACYVTYHWLYYKSNTTYRTPEFTSRFSGVCVTRSLVFCVVFCRWLFVLLSFFFWPLCCLSFFDLRLIAHLLSLPNNVWETYCFCSVSSSSYYYYYYYIMVLFKQLYWLSCLSPDIP